MGLGVLWFGASGVYALCFFEVLGFRALGFEGFRVLGFRVLGL